MHRIKWMIAAILLAGLPLDLRAQTFNSGSNGSDGALNLTTPGTIVFDPKSFNPPLDPDGDGIYHFTTVNIAAGVTVRFSGRNLNGPIYFLASGAVQVDGTMDLSGEPGHPVSFTSASVRTPAYPGAGGFVGGVGGRVGTDAPPQAGGGPGGGAAAVICSGCSNAPGAHGTFTGNQFLIPLIGGSGGGGAITTNSAGSHGGGGGGGGAILIASSTSITIRGAIPATGGQGGGGGAGAGGAIRLVANSIAITVGSLQVGSNFGTSPGVIRIETFQYTGPTLVPVVSPSGLFLPAGPNPSIRIASIAGIPIPANPTGSFTVPDAAINTSSAVPVVIEARNIPAGTIVKLRLFSEQGPDQILDTSPLAGTSAISTGTASAVFPSGYSRGFVRATWTQ